MTTEQQMDRLFYVQDWPAELTARLKSRFARDNTPIGEQFAQATRIAEDECLSVLRGGDKALDLLVAKAFDFASVSDLAIFKSSLTPEHGAGEEDLPRPRAFRA